MGLNVNGIDIASPGTTLSIANGATQWMNVSATGVVTRPQTPFMTAKLSGQGSFYTGNPVTFGSVMVNKGNCWNNSNGRFTCPVAGNYLVTMGGIAAGGNHGIGSYGYFYINKNGAQYVFSHWNNASYWEYVNLSAVVKCAAGDYITFQINGSGSGNGWYGGDSHGNFSIGLIV